MPVQAKMVAASLTAMHHTIRTHHATVQGYLRAGIGLPAIETFALREAVAAFLAILPQ